MIPISAFSVIGNVAQPGRMESSTERFFGSGATPGRLSAVAMDESVFS